MGNFNRTLSARASPEAVVILLGGPSLLVMLWSLLLGAFFKPQQPGLNEVTTVDFGVCSRLPRVDSHSS
jgi:hypothetical protein